MATGFDRQAFRALPLGAVRPTGWLRRQLRIQADGLCGHLHDFWPDVKDSGWFGGSAEGWERAPYWLDGAIPLAVLLDDEPLRAKVAACVDYILDHQAPDKAHKDDPGIHFQIGTGHDQQRHDQPDTHQQPIEVQPPGATPVNIGQQLLRQWPPGINDQPAKQQKPAEQIIAIPSPAQCAGNPFQDRSFLDFVTHRTEL